MAVVGDGAIAPDDPRGALAHHLGRALIDARYRLVTGGLGGIMRAASEGARSSPAWRDGDVIGLLPGLEPDAANPAVDVVLPTGLGHLRNLLVASADAVIAVGGGAGTLSELALAWIRDRHLIAFRTEGWSGRLADTRIDGRLRFPDGREDRVWGVDTVEEAMARLELLMGQRG